MELLFNESHSRPREDSEIKTSVVFGPGWEAGVQKPWEVGYEQSKRPEGTCGFRKFRGA